jgi:hypothetical protein
MARLPVPDAKTACFRIAVLALLTGLMTTKPVLAQTATFGSLPTVPSAVGARADWPTTGYPALEQTPPHFSSFKPGPASWPHTSLGYERLAQASALAKPAAWSPTIPDANAGASAEALPPVERLSMVSAEQEETTWLKEGGGCNHCGKHGCRRTWLGCVGGYAELLFLRPGNFDVLYSVEKTGCDAGATPTGPQGVVGPDMSTGYRVGTYVPLSECSRILAGYTWFRSSDSDLLEAAPGRVLDLVVSHPNIQGCGTDSLVASASFDVQYQFVDLAYQHLLCGGCNWGLSYLAGVRYARLTQEFSAAQNTGAATGLTTVSSNLSYDGIGLRLGLRGETHHAERGLFLYAAGDVSFLSGQHQAAYLQVAQIDPSFTIARNFEDFRLTTILETELGVGWQNETGRVRVSCGFQAAGWYNVLLTQAFLDGSRGPDTNDDFASFSGMVARVEFLR